MDKTSSFLLFSFSTCIVFAIITGVMAIRKNRNGLVWGLLGGVPFLPCSLILALLPPLCQKCRQPLSQRERKWKKCICSGCGIADGEDDERIAQELRELITQFERLPQSGRSAEEQAQWARFHRDIVKIGEHLRANGGLQRMRRVAFRLSDLGMRTCKLEFHWGETYGWTCRR